MRLAAAALVLFVSLSGCDLLGSEAEEPLALFTDREAYAVADTAQVWLRNDANEPVALGLCGSFLERQVGPAWVPVPNERGCALVLLAPSTESVVGREVTLREYVAADGFEEGTYRFSGMVAFVDRDEVSEKRLVSNAFRLSE